MNLKTVTLHDEGEIMNFRKRSPQKFPSYVVPMNEIFRVKFFSVFNFGHF